MNLPELLRERSHAQALLFPAGISLLMETLSRGGWDIRGDIVTLLGRAMQRELQAVPLARRGHVADKAADEITSVMTEVSADDLTVMWRALAHTALELAQEGHGFDKDTLLVCTAIELEWADHDEPVSRKAILRSALKLRTVLWQRGWFRDSPLETQHRISAGLMAPSA